MSPHPQISNEYMSSGTFDTHSVIKRLQKKGFPEEQAEAIVSTIMESREFDLSKIATKEQISMLQRDIEEIKNEMKNFATKADISEVKYDLLKWLIPFMMTIVALMITIMFKK